MIPLPQTVTQLKLFAGPVGSWAAAALCLLNLLATLLN